MKVITKCHECGGERERNVTLRNHRWDYPECDKCEAIITEANITKEKQSIREKIRKIIAKPIDYAVNSEAYVVTSIVLSVLLLLVGIIASVLAITYYAYDVSADFIDKEAMVIKYNNSTYKMVRVVDFMGNREDETK
jgi:hypothetical protein